MKKNLLLIVSAAVTSLAMINSASADYQFVCGDDAFSFEIPYAKVTGGRAPVGYKEGEDFIDGFRGYANNSPKVWFKNMQFATGQKLENFDFNQMFSVNQKIEDFIEKISQDGRLSGAVYPFQLGDIKFNIEFPDGVKSDYALEYARYSVVTASGEEKLLKVAQADNEGNQIPNFFDPTNKKFYQLVQGEEQNETEDGFTQPSTMRSCKFVEVDRTPEIIEAATDIFEDFYGHVLNFLETEEQQKSALTQLAQLIEQRKNNSDNLNLVTAKGLSNYTNTLNRLDTAKEQKIFTEAFLNILKDPKTTIEQIIKEEAVNVEKHEDGTPSNVDSVSNVVSEVSNAGLEFAVERITTTQEVVSQAETPIATTPRNLTSQMKKKDFLALKNQPVLVVAQHFGINFEKEKKALAHYFGIENYKATYAQNMKIKEELLKRITILD